MFFRNCWIGWGNIIRGIDTLGGEFEFQISDEEYGAANLPPRHRDRAHNFLSSGRAEKRRQDAGATIAWSGVGDIGVTASILSFLMRHGRRDGLGGAENACAILFSRT